MGLPYPGKVFTPLDVLPASDLTETTDNIEYLENKKVTNSMLDTTAGETGGVWKDVTPSPTNLTVGNGVFTYYKYTKVGKTVKFKLKFVWGSTTSASGIIYFNLPETANTNEVPATGINYIGLGGALDAGTNQYTLQSFVYSTTHFGMYALAAGGTYTSVVALNATTPMTWAENDTLTIRGEYEAA